LLLERLVDAHDATRRDKMKCFNRSETLQFALEAILSLLEVVVQINKSGWPYGPQISSDNGISRGIHPLTERGHFEKKQQSIEKHRQSQLATMKGESESYRLC
jgi:hypothetical protein